MEDIINTAEELIEYIGKPNDNYEIKFGLSNNSSRIYDIKNLLKTEIPDNTLAVYVRKTRVDKIPVRFVLKDNELEIFKKFIEENRVKVFVPIPGGEVIKSSLKAASEFISVNLGPDATFAKEKHKVLKKISDEDATHIDRQLKDVPFPARVYLAGKDNLKVGIPGLADSEKFYNEFYPELIVPEYIIFRADIPNNFAPFNGEQMKVYGPYMSDGTAIVDKFYELENECKEYLLDSGAEVTSIEVERTYNSSTIHDNNIYLYLYKTKSSK